MLPTKWTSWIGFTADDLKDINASFIDKYPQYGGKVYSLAFMRSMEVMYYNGDMLKTAGLSKPPETWDDFLKVCAALQPKGLYCYEMPGSGAASTFSSWVWGRGGELISADGKKFTFDEKAGVDPSLQIDAGRNHLGDRGGEHESGAEGDEGRGALDAEHELHELRAAVEEDVVDHAVGEELLEGLAPAARAKVRPLMARPRILAGTASVISAPMAV